MKLRLVVIVAAAFGVGYMVGTKAGREQTRRLATLAGRAGRSAPVAGTAGLIGHKLAAAATLAIEWVKDLVSVGLGWRNGDEAADAIAVEVADELAHAINGSGLGPLGGVPGGTPGEPAHRQRALAATGSRRLAQASSR